MRSGGVSGRVVAALLVVSLFSGCTGPVDEIEDPSPGSALLEHYGLEQAEQNATWVPPIGQWFFAEAEATPEGGLSAFEIKVPREAISEFDALGITFRSAGFDYIPIATPGFNESITLWGILSGWQRSSCPSQLNDNDCALFSTMFVRDTYEGSIDDPDNWQVDKLELQGGWGGFQVPVGNKRPFVVFSKSEPAAQFGLLMRLREPPDPDAEFSVPSRPSLKSVEGPVVRLATSKSSTGVTDAYLHGRGEEIRTASEDVSVKQEATTSALGFPATAFQIESGFQYNSSAQPGWGRIMGEFSGGEGVDWEFTSDLRGTRNEQAGAYYSLQGLSLGTTADYDFAAEGKGAGSTVFRASVQAAASDTSYRYWHFEVGLPLESWMPPSSG